MGHAYRHVYEHVCGIGVWLSMVMCMDMCMDVCMDISVDMCIDMCMDMCMGSGHGHVYGHAPRRRMLEDIDSAFFLQTQWIREAGCGGGIGLTHSCPSTRHYIDASCMPLIAAEFRRPKWLWMVVDSYTHKASHGGWSCQTRGL